MKKTILVDDLDGTTDAVETVTFALNGTSYEIDLTRGNSKELTTALARFVKVARPTRHANGKPKSAVPASPARRKPARKAGRGTPTSAEVRAWAKDAGVTVPSTGRIANSVVAQFSASKKSS